MTNIHNLQKYLIVALTTASALPLRPDVILAQEKATPSIVNTVQNTDLRQEHASIAELITAYDVDAESIRATLLPLKKIMPFLMERGILGKPTTLQEARELLESQLEKEEIATYGKTVTYLVKLQQIIATLEKKGATETFVKRYGGSYESNANPQFKTVIEILKSIIRDRTAFNVTVNHKQITGICFNSYFEILPKKLKNQNIQHAYLRGILNVNSQIKVTQPEMRVQELFDKIALVWERFPDQTVLTDLQFESDINTADLVALYMIIAPDMSSVINKLPQENVLAHLVLEVENIARELQKTGLSRANG